MLESYEEEKRKVLDHQTKVSETMKTMFDNFEGKFNAIINAQQRATQTRPRNRVSEKRRNAQSKRKETERLRRPSGGNSDTDNDGIDLPDDSELKRKNSIGNLKSAYAHSGHADIANRVEEQLDGTAAPPTQGSNPELMPNHFDQFNSMPLPYPFQPIIGRQNPAVPATMMPAMYQALISHIIFLYSMSLCILTHPPVNRIGLHFRSDNLILSVIRVRIAKN